MKVIQVARRAIYQNYTQKTRKSGSSEAKYEEMRVDSFFFSKTCIQYTPNIFLDSATTVLAV